VSPGETSAAEGERSRGDRVLLISLFALCVLTPLIFALTTGQIWEDFFITFRHARNFALGDGLVYQVGERVHGFTSPLNVGLLALFDRAFGAPESYLPALWAYRIVSIACFAAGGALAGRLLLQAGASRAAVAFLGCAYALQVRGVAFTVNGQEAGFLLAATALGLIAAHEGSGRNWRWMGFAWAALLWSRPDGCILIAIFALLGLLWRRDELRAQVLGIAKATLLTTALYLPWFAGAWIYYGSPIPHTITAKMGMSELEGGPEVVLQRTLENLLEGGVRCFSPVNFSFGGWPEWVRLLCLVLALAAGTIWLWPAVRGRLARMASLAFLLHGLYLGFVLAKAHLMAWYTPPTALLGLVAIAAAWPELVARLTSAEWGRLLKWVPATVVLACFLQLFFDSCVQLRAQQHEIENRVRTEIGRYLRDVVGPDETVFLEPLGYIGYFSGARMLDYPGLASPRVVEARREVGNGLVGVIPSLEPDWLVMRPGALSAAGQVPEIRDHYEIVRRFDRLATVRSLPVRGRPFLEIDARFLVLRRR
jgi:hypothetical protein